MRDNITNHTNSNDSRQRLKHMGSQGNGLQYNGMMGIQQQHLTVPVPWPENLGSSTGKLISSSRPFTPKEIGQRDTTTSSFSEPKKKKGSVRDFQFKYKTEVLLLNIYLLVM